MGVYLSTPKTEKSSEDGENERIRFGLSAMQGWRTAMEDAHVALPNLDECTSFFAVFDGHGGNEVSRFCAKYLHTRVLKDEAYSTGDLATPLRSAFFRMDEMMKGQRGWRELAELKQKGWSSKVVDPERGDEWALEDGEHASFSGPNAGSTACVAMIRNNQLVVANAGDSRCVISRKGQALNLSKDHKPELEEERDRILKAGGFIQAGRVNGSLNLARAIGDKEFKTNTSLPPEEQTVTAEPDITTVELTDDDEFIILACDGIWDCMSSQEAVDFVHEQISRENCLATVCENVLYRCLAPSTSSGEGCDNMTVMVVQFKRSSHPVTASGAAKSTETVQPEQEIAQQVQASDRDAVGHSTGTEEG